MNQPARMLTRTEDETTEQLAKILNFHPGILDSFLRLLKLPPGEFAFNTPNVEVKTQVSIPGGRIDLLLKCGSNAVIIECKIGDRQKRYQLAKYHDFWLNTFGKRPYLIWLTRKHDESLIGYKNKARTGSSYGDNNLEIVENIVSRTRKYLSIVDAFSA